LQRGQQMRPGPRVEIRHPMEQIMDRRAGGGLLRQRRFHLRNVDVVGAKVGKQYDHDLDTESRDAPPGIVGKLQLPYHDARTRAAG
jgi:hypothetical protein